MKKRLSLLLAIGAIISLVGCNTMGGLGQDMEEAGDEIQDAAN
jgi:predicted small secreted protein